MTARVAASLLVAAGLVLSEEARAEPRTCASTEEGGPGLTEADAAQRLALVRGALRDDARDAWAWSLAWGGAGVALTAGGVAYGALTSDPGQRIDAYYGAATSALMPVLAAVWPMRVMVDEPAARPVDGDSSTGACESLALAGRLLARDAEDEALRVGFVAHALTLASSVLLALPLGLVWGRWGSAALDALSSEAIGEAQVLTTPTGARRGFERYRQGAVVGPLAPVPAPSWASHAAGSAAGLTLRVRF